jgi:tRNA dimethylallyltransferase
VSPERRLVALFGATASGKTTVASAAARQHPFEVISADSRQLRRGMLIGTASPTVEDRAAVPHHLVEIVEPDAPWTLADWIDAATEAIEEVWSRGSTPLLLAGTGQYAWALLEGWQVPRVPPNPERRAELEALAASEGASAVHALLRVRDVERAERIEPANVRRVIRAIEIVEATGGPVRPLERRAPDWPWRAVGLRWERELLYERADRRAEAMYVAGLIDEARTLVERYGNSFEALRSIGYAEALPVLRGELTSEAALERTQTATHRLIRVQGNWFRNDDERIEWVDGKDPAAAAAAVVAAASAPMR